jgi:putative heme-binding domain-containing protein
LNYTVETKDGQTWSGLIAGESENSVTLRGPNGVETVVLRSNIARLQSQGQSVMPEGLEAGLKLEEFADLLEYIVTARE